MVVVSAQCFAWCSRVKDKRLQEPLSISEIGVKRGMCLVHGDKSERRQRQQCEGFLGSLVPESLEPPHICLRSSFDQQARNFVETCTQRFSGSLELLRYPPWMSTSFVHFLCRKTK